MLEVPQASERSLFFFIIFLIVTFHIDETGYTPFFLVHWHYVSRKGQLCFSAVETVLPFVNNKCFFLLFFIMQNVLWILSWVFLVVFVCIVRAWNGPVVCKNANKVVSCLVCQAEQNNLLLIKELKNRNVQKVRKSLCFTCADTSVWRLYLELKNIVKYFSH